MYIYHIACIYFNRNPSSPDDSQRFALVNYLEYVTTNELAILDPFS